jgi:tRNA 2-thiouridine synthesizing protein A
MTNDDTQADGDKTGDGKAGIEQLDARHLLCPLPVIRTQNRVATLATGSVLEVLATDPGVLQDIPAWCRVHGHRFLGAERDGREIRCRLEVRHGRA